jgi:hypothetical protein
MLSFAGELAEFDATGVGEGSGWAGIMVRAARADFRVVLAEAATAKAKLLRDKPATHARAQVLTATFLKCLGIDSLLRDWLDHRHALARNAFIKHSERGRTTRKFSLLSKKRTKGFVQGFGRS